MVEALGQRDTAVHRLQETDGPRNLQLQQLNVDEEQSEDAGHCPPSIADLYAS
jgi:hypothetical protein